MMNFHGLLDFGFGFNQQYLTLQLRKMLTNTTQTLISEKRHSNSTQNSQIFKDSESFTNSQDIRTQLIFCSPVQKQIFRQKVTQAQITSVLHRKSVDWLAAMCQAKDYPSEVLWVSIGLFYGYRSIYQINKKELTLILSVALNLSLKLHQPTSVMKKQELLRINKNECSWERVRQIQAYLMLIFNYDLYFPISLSHILSLPQSQTNISKILFLSQVLFMTSYDPAINQKTLSDIKQIINDPLSQSQLKTQILKILKKTKSTKTLMTKYQCKFDLYDFIKKLENNETEKII